jgi:hypothetical protein
MSEQSDDWLSAVRRELVEYQAQHDDQVVRLQELYDTSEDRLAAKFPDNDTYAQRSGKRCSAFVTAERSTLWTKTAPTELAN